MNLVPCLYAIVRFCPFVETEEFANVGVLLVAPQHHYFGFKLMTKKHARVTNFFDQLGTKVFKTSISNLKEELDRARLIVAGEGSNSHSGLGNNVIPRAIFDEIVRPRETVLKFSTTRVVMAAEPKAKLNELYGHYVERDFVTPEYREAALEKTMRKWLNEAGVASRFERAEVGNEEYHATFPFVEQRGTEVLTAVKPLNLGQEQPSKILDHGGAWVWRLSQLKKKNLMPERVLFAAEGPGDAETARTKAFDDVVMDLEAAGAAVINYDRKDQIIRFLS